jgi:hypothetical protein
MWYPCCLCAPGTPVQSSRCAAVLCVRLYYVVICTLCCPICVLSTPIQCPESGYSALFMSNVMPCCMCVPGTPTCARKVICGCALPSCHYMRALLRHMRTQYANLVLSQSTEATFSFLRQCSLHVRTQYAKLVRRHASWGSALIASQGMHLLLLRVRTWYASLMSSKWISSYIYVKCDALLHVGTRYADVCAQW